jgi:hypothetical protein
VKKTADNSYATQQQCDKLLQNVMWITFNYQKLRLNIVVFGILTNAPDSICTLAT